MLCTGVESYHIELRARVVCELSLNKDFYLTPSIVSLFDNEGTLISKNVLMAVSAQYHSTMRS